MAQKKNQIQRIQKSRLELLLKFPFIGQLALHLKIVERPDIKTAATDGRHYFYNAEYIKKLNDKELNFVTAHEVLHVVLLHLWRRQGLNYKLYNIAADYVINAMIKEFDPAGEVFQLTKNCLYNRSYTGMYTEEVYDLLLKNGQANLEKLLDALIDNHDTWYEGASQTTPGATSGSLRDMWKSRMVQAWNNHSNHSTTNKSSLVKRMFKDLLEPQKNWRQLLKEFLQFEINDYSLLPPNRRMNHMADFGIDVIFSDWNAREQEKLKIVFAVDTSGSVDEKQFNMTLTEVLGCIRQFNGNVEGKLIFCDDEIASDGVYDLLDADQALPSGGGGTDFRPVFRWIEQNLDNDCNALVYLTDGEGSFPIQEPPYPVLWILLTRPGSQPESVPFGQSAVLYT
jgi:predicted metal-dependent peptidase